jgi:hypothetical protein
MLEPTGEIAMRGFALTITGGGHGLSYMAVRKALLEVRETGRQVTHASGQFGSITDLLGLPEVYEIESRYVARSLTA